MNRSLITICLLLAGLLSGCGALDPFMQDSSLTGYTRVTIGNGNRAFDPLTLKSTLDPIHALTGANMSGGIMLWVVGAGGTPGSSSYFVASETATANFVLPNGSYFFYSTGYAAPNFTSGGVIECGFGYDPAASTTPSSPVAITLGGGSRVIQMDLQYGVNSPCANGHFSPTAYIDTATGSYYTLKVISCNAAGMAGVSSALSTCSSTNMGAANSVTVSLLTVDLAGNLTAGGISSGCQTGTSGIVTTTVALPIGTGSSGPQVRTVVKTFSDSGCSTALGSYLFPAGIFENTKVMTMQNGAATWTNNSGYALVYPYTGSLTTNLYLRDLP